MYHPPEHNRIWISPTVTYESIEQRNYEARLMEACDTIWKLRYIKGEVSLYQYLIKEAERLQGIV